MCAYNRKSYDRSLCGQTQKHELKYKKHDNCHGFYEEEKKASLQDSPVYNCANISVYHQRKKKQLQPAQELIF